VIFARTCVRGFNLRLNLHLNPVNAKTATYTMSIILAGKTATVGHREASALDGASINQPEWEEKERDFSRELDGMNLPSHSSQ
jgi:hypothetical protein